MKIIWQEEETAPWTFQEDLAGFETESDYDPSMAEEEAKEPERPSTGQGFS